MLNLNDLRNWRIGAYRIGEDEIFELKRIKSNVKLVEGIPSTRDIVKLNLLSNCLLSIHSFLLKNKRSWAGFEVWKYDNAINYYLFARDLKTLEELKSQFNAIYQNAIFKEANVSFIPTHGFVCGAYVFLNNYLLKSRSIEDFEHDPLSHLLEAMQPNSIIQVIFKAERIKEKKIEKIRTLEMGEGIKQRIISKLSLPCFRVLIRAIAISEDPERAREIIEHITNSFSVFNGEIATYDSHIISYPVLLTSFSILKRMFERKFPRFYNIIEYNKTFILSLPELASIVHLPTKAEMYRKTAVSKNDRVQIGFVKFRGKPIEKASIPIKDLSRHLYVLGASGTGKSSLLINLIAQLAEKGICVHVIDPHGDLSYEIIESLPHKEVILLDPLKVRFSINPFELPHYRDNYERQILIEKIIGQMVEMMKRIFGHRYWGPSLNRTFQNVIRLLYEKDDSPTFEDILNVLLGRYERLGSLALSRSLREFLEELEKIPKERLDSVINKVDPFVKNSLLRMLFCKKKSTIDFNELIKPGKLVLWRLSKAELTEQNMQMIGSAIITKLWFQVSSREREERSRIFLVIDEFQNFAYLETLTIMITEGRKFGISLILSHQHTMQLPEKALGEVLGNTATKIIFRVSGEDAYKLAKSLDIRKARELVSILTSMPDGTAIVKVRAGFGEEPTEPFEIFTLKPLKRKRVNLSEIIEEMRRKFGAPTTQHIQTPPRFEELDEKTIEILEVIDEVGEKGIGEVSKNLGINPSRLKQILKHLEDKEFVTISKKKFLVGRPRTVIKLTKKGREAIGKFLGREGSITHRMLVNKIAKKLEELGWKVEIPRQGGRREQPDLIARSERETIAIEVETSAEHPDQIRRNYMKNRGYDRVIFIVPNERVGEKIKRILGEVEVYVA